MNAWINCAEQLPQLRPCCDGSMDESDYVLAFVPGGLPEFTVAQLLDLRNGDGPHWEADSGDSYYYLDAKPTITHWMPLPLPPDSAGESREP